MRSFFIVARLAYANQNGERRGKNPSVLTMRVESLPLADAVQHYLLEHIDRRVTIAELSERFEVSQTQLKLCFRNAYGKSVYSYARQAKMEAAARLLLESDTSVLEIAGQVGYENASKFARAFGDVMGMTPTKFRKKYKKTN